MNTFQPRSRRPNLPAKGGAERTSPATAGNRLSLLLVLLLALGIGGCASPSGGGGGGDTLERAEIEASSATDVHRLIQTRRPSWLRERGAVTLRTTPTDDGELLQDAHIVVYLDGVRHGIVDDLRSLPTTGVTSIQRLSAADATQRFGTGHPRGAIVISRTP